MSKLIGLILTATLALPRDNWTTVTRIPAAANGDAIRINGQGGVTSIPRSEVEQESVARKRKARNVGSGIGAAFGAVSGTGYAPVYEVAKPR